MKSRPGGRPRPGFPILAPAHPSDALEAGRQSRIVNQVLLTAGVAAVVIAIVGGGAKALGFEVPGW